MELIAQTTIIGNGGSLHLLIPSGVAKIMGWKKGDKIGVYKDGNQIIYKKEEKKE